MKLRLVVLPVALLFLAAASTTASAASTSSGNESPAAFVVRKPCQYGTRTIKVNGRSVTVCRRAKAPTTVSIPASAFAPSPDGACNLLRPRSPC